MKLIIPGQLPGLNEYINAERSSKYQGAAMKRQAEHTIIMCIKQQLRGVRFDRPVHMTYRWIEPNMRRDCDNIAFAKKFIQDALVKAGVLENDGWAQIAGFADLFEVDKSRPRVEVEIREV